MLAAEQGCCRHIAGALETPAFPTSAFQNGRLSLKKWAQLVHRVRTARLNPFTR
jgi:hypothetical protein